MNKTRQEMVDALDNRGVIREISSQVTATARTTIAYYKRLLGEHPEAMNNTIQVFDIKESSDEQTETITIQSVRPGAVNDPDYPEEYRYFYKQTYVFDSSSGEVMEIRGKGISYKRNQEENSIEISASIKSSTDGYNVTQIKMRISSDEATLTERNYNTPLNTIDYTLKRMQEGLVWIPIGGMLYQCPVDPQGIEKIIPNKIFHHIPSEDSNFVGTPIWTSDQQTGHTDITNFNTDPNRPMEGIPMQYIIDLIARDPVYYFKGDACRPYLPLHQRFRMYDRDVRKRHFGTKEVILFSYVTNEEPYLANGQFCWLSDPIYSDQHFMAIVKDTSGVKIHKIKTKYTMTPTTRDSYRFTYTVSIDGEEYEIAMGESVLCTKHRIGNARKLRPKLLSEGIDVVSITEEKDNKTTISTITYREKPEEIAKWRTRDAIIQAIEAKYSTE